MVMPPAHRPRIGFCELLGTPTLDAFLEDVWERATRLNPGAVRESVSRILTLEQFEILMAGTPAGPASWLSIVDGRARPVGGEPGSAVRMAAAYHAYRAGSTLLQGHMELRWPAIASLCRDLESELLGRGVPLAEAIGANAYLTRAQTRGFDIHYDDHCVLILQLHGRKHWEVFAPTRELPVERCEQAIPRDQLDAPVVDTELTPGDVLYIPRGFPHAARSGDDSSLHLTLAIRTRTWLHALEELCRSRVAFRRSLPPTLAGSTRAQEHLERHLLPELAGLNVDDFARRKNLELLSELNPLPQGRLRAIDTVSAIGSDTPVRRAPHVTCVASLEDGQAVLRFPGATLRLHAVMKQVFDFIAAAEEFTADELPPIHGTYDAVELTRILVQQGLVRVKTGASTTPGDS